jgi:hypothetical protein
MTLTHLILKGLNLLFAEQMNADHSIFKSNGQLFIFPLSLVIFEVKISTSAEWHLICILSTNYAFEYTFR